MGIDERKRRERERRVGEERIEMADAAPRAARKAMTQAISVLFDLLRNVSLNKIKLFNYFIHIYIFFFLL